MLALKIENELERIIYDIELRLGVSPSARGYHCIKFGIAACLHDPSLAANFKKRLYPHIAGAMDMSETAVEKSIRSAVSLGWHRHDEKLAADIFKNLLQSKSDPPSNTIFITTVTEWIRLHYPDLVD